MSTFGTKRRFFVWVMLMLLAGVSSGQVNVRIEGTSDNAAGKKVGMYAYEDMLTLAEVIVDSTTIAADGSFALSCYANYPRLVFLQIENYSQSFYIEAGRTYKVHIPEFDWTIDEQRNIHLMPEPLPLLFDQLPADELNLRIGRYDQVVDSLLTARRGELDLRFRPSRKAFEKMEREADRAVSESDSNSFLARYKMFTMAQMRLAMHISSRGKLYQRYIEGQPIRYHDENYMRFFFALYDHCISRGTARIPMHRMVEWVSELNLEAMLDSVGLDPLLRNERVRELAVLQALKEAYYDRDYPSEQVKQMVHRIGTESKFEEHRRLALQIEQRFVRLESGAEVPSMMLPDVDKQMVDLTSYLGKWVYLSFVRVSDPACLAEIITMAHFHDSIVERYPNVEFVTISCDREFQKMYHFLKSSRRGAKVHWPWLHFDGNYRLLEHLGVVSFPTFILVDPEGYQHYSVTPPPASGILLHGPWEEKEAEEESILPFIKQ